MTQLERELTKELELQREAFERELKRIGDEYAQILAAAEARMKRMQQNYENELKHVVESYESKLKELVEKPVKIVADKELSELLQKLEKRLIDLEKELEMR